MIESSPRCRPAAPRARHLAVSAAFARGIVGLEDTGLTFVRLRESISALLAHALHLSYLSNGLLELLHPVCDAMLEEDRRLMRIDHTWDDSLVRCTSESLECGGRFAESTCVWRFIEHRVSLRPLSNNQTASTYYFHAKSRMRQRMGNTKAISQKIGLGKSLAMTPWYSVENFIELVAMRA